MKPRKDGRYVKKKVINGKAVFFYSDEKTERAAQKDIDRQMLAYASKVAESENFGAIAEEWLSMKKDEVGHKTYLTYKETVSRLGSLANKKTTHCKRQMFKALSTDYIIRAIRRP